jgi:heme exporter protein D
MIGIMVPASPTPSSGGSWLWALAAIAFVLVVLALTWLASLWGRRAVHDERQREAVREQRAASVEHRQAA